LQHALSKPAAGKEVKMFGIKGALIAALAAFWIFSLSGCEKEGPAEKAGETIDQTVEKARENLEEAKEELADKLEQQGPAEKAGEKIDEAVEEAREKVRKAKEKLEEAMEKSE
jgi:hypothetical protein